MATHDVLQGTPLGRKSLGTIRVVQSLQRADRHGPVLVPQIVFRSSPKPGAKMTGQVLGVRIGSWRWSVSGIIWLWHGTPCRDLNDAERRTTLKSPHHLPGLHLFLLRPGRTLAISAELLTLTVGAHLGERHFA
jgi:hypothetical protein